MSKTYCVCPVCQALSSSNDSQAIEAVKSGFNTAVVSQALQRFNIGETDLETMITAIGEAAYVNGQFPDAVTAYEKAGAQLQALLDYVRQVKEKSQS